jgi:hypothetical protein
MAQERQEARIEPSFLARQDFHEAGLQLVIDPGVGLPPKKANARLCASSTISSRSQGEATANAIAL